MKRSLPLGNAVSKEDDGRAPRFVVDAMLGRVARELRLLGYDAVFERAADDSALLRRAQAEDRILLTRDRGLAARARGVRCLVLHSDLPLGTTREVMAALGEVRPPGVLSRCTECNALLEPLPKEEARERVPDHVANGVLRFLHCPGCGRVYWPGTHAARLEEKVRRLLARVASRCGTGKRG